MPVGIVVFLFVVIISFFQIIFALIHIKVLLRYVRLYEL